MLTCHFNISGKVGDHFKGNDTYIPYTGNFTNIRNVLNLSPLSLDDPKCRFLVFSLGELINEMSLNCDEPFLWFVQFTTLCQ